MTLTHACDLFGASTSVGDLHIVEMKNVLDDLEGDVKDVVAIILDA